MIGHFPDPFPDEVLYSACARYSDHVQYPNKVSYFQELFGDKGVNAVVDLPCRLGYLANNLPSWRIYTLEVLIDCYTLLPLYSPFLPEERLSLIREQMNTGSGKAIHRRTGITSSSVPRPLWLRYCPVCIETDRAEHGEAYWHRLHQAPGVEVCPLHATFLENSTIPIQSSFTSKAFVSAEQTIKAAASPRPAASSPYHKILMEIALDVSYLLNHPIVSPGTHFFREQYLALLASSGFMNASGLIRTIELLQAFMDYYPQELLALLHCEINQTQNKQNNWLATMPYLHRKSRHPLRHLLLIRFLGSTVEAFFHHPLANPKETSSNNVTSKRASVADPVARKRSGYIPKGPESFRNGSWPCLNPTCEYYRELHISVCQVNERSEKGRPVGRFTCDCGFSYSRTGPDRLPEDAFRRDKILSYGHIWEIKLRELWTDSAASLRKISRQLGVSLDAVNRQATRLGLPVPRNSPWPNRTGKPRKSITKPITWYRTQWLTLLNKEPGSGISNPRRRLPGVYSWLLRHDREWLVAHRPLHRPPGRPKSLTQKYPRRSKRPRPQKDIEGLDAQTAESIRIVASKLINNPNPPERISFRKLSIHIPQVNQLKYQLDRMPLAAQALQEAIESREAFAVRRIWWVVERYRRENIFPTRSQLMVRASVYGVADKPQVKQAIDSALETLS